MALNGMIVDVDGTLIATNFTHAQAWVEGLARCGYRFSVDRVAREIGKGGDLLLPSLLGEQLAERDGDAVRAAVSAAFRRLASVRRFRVFDGVEALMRALRVCHVQLAIATSATEEDLEFSMRSAGVDLRVSAARSAGAVTLGVCSSGLADGHTLARRLVRAGARQTWSGVAAMLEDVDHVLAIASPTRLHLSVAEQELLMRPALEAAREGMSRGEAPIGCVLYDGDGREVARAWNEMQGSQNKTAHAEIVAFARAAGRVSLEANDLVLVSTLEPCVMCTGAAMVSAVDTILFALRAPADSGTGRVTPPESPESLMPRIVGNVLAHESRALFEGWLEGNVDEAQARYGRQLLATT